MSNRTPQELAEKIRKENEPLFEYARVNVQHFFNNPKTTKEDLIRHFTGRLTNIGHFSSRHDSINEAGAR